MNQLICSHGELISYESVKAPEMGIFEKVLRFIFPAEVFED